MRKIEEKFFKALMIVSSITILGVLLYILYTVVVRGLPSL